MRTRLKVKVAVAIAVLVTMPVLASSERVKPNYKVTRMSVQDVGVSCWNGRMPEVKVVGRTVVVGCDAE